MNFLVQLSLGWQCMLRTVGRLGRPQVWGPFLPLLFAQTLLLSALVFFAHPWVSWALRRWLLWRGGYRALRYPDAYVGLPRHYADLDLVLGLLVGSLVVGAATRVFADLWLGGRPAVGPALVEAFRRWPALLVVQLPLYLVTLPLAFGVGGFLAITEHTPFATLLGHSVIYVGTLGFQALFLFLPPLVMLERHGPVSALRALPGAWSRGLGAAVMMSIVLIITLLPFVLMRSVTPWIIGAGWPEAIPWILGLEVLCTLALNVIMTGAATLAFLAVVAEDTREPW
jgi:hypothetical protein